MIAYEGEILWQNNKLVFLRTHENSISVKSIDLNAYTSAEKDFLNKIQELMTIKNIEKSFRNYIFYKLIIWFSHNSANVLKRNKSINYLEKIKIFLHEIYK